MIKQAYGQQDIMGILQQLMSRPEVMGGLAGAGLGGLGGAMYGDGGLRNIALGALAGGGLGAGAGNLLKGSPEKKPPMNPKQEASPKLDLSNLGKGKKLNK